MKKIILASASPRRRELLAQLGIEFDVIPSMADEKIYKDTPADYVEALSERKCMEVAERISDNEAVVIGADTIVVFDGEIMGKPKDASDAKEMLRKLSGNEHSVFTGVTLYDKASGKKITFSEETLVKMFELTENEIREYVKTGEPMDKAGAYGIQGKGAALIESVNGDFYNVVGLPVARTVRNLKKIME